MASPLFAATRSFWAGITPTQRGLILMATASCSSTCMNAAIRHLTTVGDLHPFAVGFFRSALSLVMMSTVLMHAGFAPLRTTKIGFHVLRAALNLGAMLLFIMGLSLEPLARVTALGFTTPLFATVAAWLILRESMHATRVIGFFTGLVGACIILRPGFDAVGIGAMYVIGSCLIWAFALVDIKHLTKTESSVTITLYAMLLQTPMALAPALLHWSWPNLEQLAWLTAAAAFGISGQMFLSQAFREADATAVMPVDFVKLIWASMLGFVLFGEIPNVWTWIGGSIVFGSVLYVALRDHRARKSAAAPPLNQP